MIAPLLVFLGGGLGATARYGVGFAWLRLLGPGRPWGATLVINVTGGFLMGLLVAVLAERGGGWSERVRLLVGVGVLGGFTTFSTFSMETALMIERRDYGLAAGYSAASVTLSVLGLFAGLMLGRRLFA
jgi:CrcB protein